MPDTTVDHGPPVINHTGLTAGLPWLISWGFGPAATPDNLTGKTVTLVLKGVRMVLPVDLVTGTATYAPSAAQTVTMGWATPYLLLLNDQLEVKGTLAVSQVVTP